MPDGSRPRARTLAGAALAALVAAGVAAAGGPGQWTPISKGASRSSDDVALARSSDGVLHVLWQRRGRKISALWETRVAPDETTAADAVAGGLIDAGSPAATVAPDGTLRAFSFVRAAAGSGWNLQLAVRSPSGAWSVSPEALAQAPAAEAPTAAAAATRDGTPLVAWVSGAQIRFRFGVDPAAAGASLAAGCCATGVVPAVDQESGQAYLAWASGAPGGAGVYVQAIDRNGASRPRVYATGSANRRRRLAVLPAGRVALSARAGATGVYLAYATGYPKPRGITLLDVGARRRVLAVKAPGAAHVVLASGPLGRMWLAWSRGGTIYVTRTDRAVTRIGAVRAVPIRRGARLVDRLAAEGSPGTLDLVASFETRGGAVRFWQEQVLPGLSLGISATATGGSTRYLFRVSDAGEPVANATVRFGKQSLTTGVSGTVVLVTGDRPGSATASKPGYAPATTPLPAAA